MEPSLVLVLLVAGFVGLAAGWDLFTRRIPNFMTVPMAAGGLAFHALAPTGHGSALALSGLALGMGLLLLPFLLGGSGGGDVKLLAALGAWLGPVQLLIAFLLSVFTAAFLAVLVTTYVAIDSGIAKSRGRFLGTTTCGDNATQTGKRVLPFALPVAVGTWLLLAWLSQHGAL